MSDESRGSDILLGKNTRPATAYAPELLYPISRSVSRDALGMSHVPCGADLWHAYEMSWLEASGKPVARVGRFTLPATTPHIIESKSFKLYLNSLNNERFDNDQAAIARIVSDVSAVAGDAVALELLSVDDSRLAGASLEGDCLDALPLESAIPGSPSAAQLSATDTGEVVEQKLYSHLLRSLCPVTGQPDWATVWLHYRGKTLDRVSLLRYLLAFRNHREFHEQCVERMFHDILQKCAPEFLHIQGFYTRRGGMDINPFRSTDPAARPLPRLNRQ